MDKLTDYYSDTTEILYSFPPLVTGHGEGKSYIYSNFNLKYVHSMLTILRTYLNFCETLKYKKEDVPPAMLLGIADKPFTMEDIIYFK